MSRMQNVALGAAVRPKTTIGMPTATSWSTHSTV